MMIKKSAQPTKHRKMESFNKNYEKLMAKMSQKARKNRTVSPKKRMSENNFKKSALMAQK